MSLPQPHRSERSAIDRWFYAGATLLLLVLVICGFHFFYFQGRAYPGARELTPPIRTLVITHGVAMTLWMVLAIVQPALVASGNVKIHRKVGTFTAALAVVLVGLGLKLGLESTRVAPPGMMFGPFTPRQFMAVPVLDMVLFGSFVTLGIFWRQRPPIHRAMMFLATLTAVAAAISRIDTFNNLYYGTIFQMLFGDFFFAVVIGGLLLVAKRILTKSWDRPLAIGYAALTLAYLFIAQFMGTAAWGKLADFLLA